MGLHGAQTLFNTGKQVTFEETLGPSGRKTFCTPARQLSVIRANLTSNHTERSGLQPNCQLFDSQNIIRVEIAGVFLAVVLWQQPK